MEPSVPEELNRLAQVIAKAVPDPILREVLRVNPDDLEQVRRVVVKFHPFARGLPRGAHPTLKDKDAWGAVESAAHYTEITGKPVHAYDVLSVVDPTIRICYGPVGFRQLLGGLRMLVWAFCGQPGRLEHLDNEGFFDDLSPYLWAAVEQELKRFGKLDPARELNVVLESLGAKVVTESVEPDRRWGSIVQMQLAPGPLPEPVEGAFWRRVFTAFRGAFVLNPTVDLTLPYRKLSELAKGRRKRLDVPSHSIPQTKGGRARRFVDAVEETANLVRKGYLRKQIAARMRVSERTVYYRLEAARKRGLLDT